MYLVFFYYSIKSIDRMQKLVIVVINIVLMVSFTRSAPQAAKQYPLRLQPELDSFIGKIDQYIRNERLFNFQVKCLMDEGPCDIIGKFLKPRIAKGLLGDCVMCTPAQKEAMNTYLERFQRNRPALYRSLFLKYIEKVGINVDDDKKAEIFEEQKIEEAKREKYTIQNTTELKDVTTEATIINTKTNYSWH